MLTALEGLPTGKGHPQSSGCSYPPSYSPFLSALCSMPQDLSEALKEATKEVHTRAENAEFMRNFQKGQVTREGFKVCVLGEGGVTGVGVPEARPGVSVGLGPGMLRDQIGMS